MKIKNSISSYTHYLEIKKKSKEELQEMTKEELIKCVMNRNLSLEYLHDKFIERSIENIFFRRKINELEFKIKMLLNGGNRTFGSYRSYRRNKNVKERKD